MHGRVMTKPKRAAIYLRVSTDRQTAENQLAEVQQLAEARGFAPVVYRETESAAKKRPVLDGLMEDARRGKVRAVVVWALDRLDRNMVECINRVVELDRLGVPVISVREAWLDTSGPTRSLQVAIFGWVAEQERGRLIERTKAGLERARREGKRLGRPMVLTDKQVAKVKTLRGRGASWAQVAATVGCKVGAARLAASRKPLPILPARGWASVGAPPRPRVTRAAASRQCDGSDAAEGGGLLRGEGHGPGWHPKNGPERPQTSASMIFLL
jgi:putative DNA-invertase from lambdoid prophage Rac